MEKDKPCPKKELFSKEEHGPWQKDHVCPFKQDINDDSESLCNCCEECTHECAMDI